VVKSEVDKFYSWYNVDGIFFDEVATSCSYVTGGGYYQKLYNYVQAKTTGAKMVVLNPGTNVPECYMNCSSVIVTFESPLSEYSSYTASSWNSKYGPTRFWHIIYNVPKANLSSVLLKAKSNYAGLVYITDDLGANPYDTLPSYISNEYNQVRLN